jgi:hypothetical protein
MSAIVNTGNMSPDEREQFEQLIHSNMDIGILDTSHLCIINPQIISLDHITHIKKGHYTKSGTIKWFVLIGPIGKFRFELKADCIFFYLNVIRIWTTYRIKKINLDIVMNSTVP